VLLLRLVRPMRVESVLVLENRGSQLRPRAAASHLPCVCNIYNHTTHTQRKIASVPGVRKQGTIEKKPEGPKPFAPPLLRRRCTANPGRSFEQAPSVLKMPSASTCHEGRDDLPPQCCLWSRASVKVDALRTSMSADDGQRRTQARRST